MGVRKIAIYKDEIIRVVLFYFLFILIIKGLNYQLPFQLQQSPLFIADFDLMYWFFNYSGLRILIYQNFYGGLVFCIFLIITNLLAIVFVRKRIFLLMFAVLFFIYALGFNIHLTHSSHLYAGIILLPFCLLAKRDVNFELFWEAYRYYVCWIYFSAFLMKLYYGSFFQVNFGELAFKENVAWIMYSNPNGLRTHLYSFFIRNAFLLDIGFYIAVFLEGSFVFGFFTKKIDRLFFYLILILHILFYFFVDVVFFEQLMLMLLFLNVKDWQRIRSYFKKYNSLKFI